MFSKKRVTSLEVARAAGVSRTTVSLVLNEVPDSGIPEATRRRVLEAADRLNYHPNVSGRRLVSGRTHTVAFVIHQSPERAAADLFFPQVLRGLSASLERDGYHILFHSVDPEQVQEGYTYLIYQGQVDGIVLSGPQLEEPEAVELFNQKLPIVILGRLPGYDIPCVDADNYLGAIQATNHLIEHGHRRIGLITNAPLTYVASRERFRGYQDALLAAELLYDPALVQEGCFTSESGFQAMNILLDLDEGPTAIFVASDVVALGAMQAVKRRGGRIPERVAFVGFDDISIAQYLEPSLTTVRLPAYDLGRQAGQLILRSMHNGATIDSLRLLPTELVVRRSCGTH